MSGDYCGCCGREIKWGTPEWCMDCIRDHIDTTAERVEDRTWYAQHGTDCPFQVGRFAAHEADEAFLYRGARVFDPHQPRPCPACVGGRFSPTHVDQVCLRCGGSREITK